MGRNSKLILLILIIVGSSCSKEFNGTWYIDSVQSEFGQNDELFRSVAGIIEFESNGSFKTPLYSKTHSDLCSQCECEFVTNETLVEGREWRVEISDCDALFNGLWLVRMKSTMLNGVQVDSLKMTSEDSQTVIIASREWH